MMDFMNVFVEGTPVKCSMCPIVKGIFHDKEDCNLPCHGPPVGEGNVNEKTKVINDGMEEINLG